MPASLQQQPSRSPILVGVVFFILLSLIFLTVLNMRQRRGGTTRGGCSTTARTVNVLRESIKNHELGVYSGIYAATASRH